MFTSADLTSVANTTVVRSLVTAGKLDQQVADGLVRRCVVKGISGLAVEAGGDKVEVVLFSLGQGVVLSR